MTHKELLNKVQIGRSCITDKLRFVIVKKQNGSLVEISESRELTDQEVLVYTTESIDYLLLKGHTEISDPDTKEVWKFSKETKK